MAALARLMRAGPTRERTRFAAAFHPDVFLHALVEAYPEFAGVAPDDG